MPVNTNGNSDRGPSGNEEKEMKINKAHNDLVVPGIGMAMFDEDEDEDEDESRFLGCDHEDLTDHLGDDDDDDYEYFNIIIGIKCQSRGREEFPKFKDDKEEHSGWLDSVYAL